MFTIHRNAQASGFSATDSGGFRETPHADIRPTSRVNWNDLRSLIEGEAIVLFGKDRVYAKLFYAEIDANGPLRMNRPLMLRPPSAGEVRDAAERGRAIGRHLRAGRATHSLHADPSPTLEALVHGFKVRATAQDAPGMAACADAAIRALRDVEPDVMPAPPAMRAAKGKPNPDVTETEHSAILEASFQPSAEEPPPSVPRQPPKPDAARSLAAIEAEAGASPADARARMNQTVAIREEAEEEELPALPPIAPGEFRALLETLITDVDAITPRSSPHLQAAE